MNRELLKGRYTLPFDQFEQFDSLCNRFHYTVEPTDGNCHRIGDQNTANPWACMFLEYDGVAGYLLTVVHTRSTLDETEDVSFAGLLYSRCNCVYIGPL